MTLPRPLRALLRILAIALLLVAIAAAAVSIWLRSSLPQRDGTQTVAGISGLVTIARDAHGVPHIEASTFEDGAFAMGYVHAQDRFFEMDLARRLVNGHLSELLGPRTLWLDERSVHLRFASYLQGELDALDPQQQKLLDAYVLGVNAQLARGGAPWALRLLRAAHPKPWTALDTAALVLYMDDRLSEDGDEELRWRTVAKVGARTARWLMDVEPQGAATIAGHALDGSDNQAPAERSGSARLPSPPPFVPSRGDARGSNAWAIDGRWTQGGGALLANDTHLMHALPALFYVCELRLPGRTLAGMTIPGAPLVVIGTNGALAWGVTTLYNDAIDYVAEQFAAGDSTRVLREGGSEPVQQQLRFIRVRGRAAPDTVRVRWTSQGPLIHLDDSARLFSRRWVREAGSGTLAAMFALQDAISLEQAHAALASYAGPGQSFVLADTLVEEGRVGWVPAGRWLHRPDCSAVTVDQAPCGGVTVDGTRLPAGFPALEPYARRPVLLPAPDGLVVTANNRPADGEAGLRMSSRWPLPWRAMRIGELLQRRRPLAASELSRMQMDPVVESARRFAALLAATTPPATCSDEVRSWWKRMAQWDGAMAGDELPTLWRATMDRLAAEIFVDDWPGVVIEPAPSEWGARTQPLPLERATLRVLGLMGTSPEAVADDSLDARDWLDDQRTAAHEDAGQIVARSLQWALEAVRSRYGAHPSHWRWDRVHTLTMLHPLASVPILGRWLRLGPAAVVGDRHAICANAARDADDLEVDTIPVMRIVIDLKTPSNSRYVLSTGESEHPLSAWFKDQFPLWVRGEMLPLFPTATREAVGGRLALEPAGRGGRS